MEITGDEDIDEQLMFNTAILRELREKQKAQQNKMAQKMKEDEIKM